MKPILLGLTLLSLSVTAPACADNLYPPRKVISEAALRWFSDHHYLKIIAGSFAAGRHYTYTQISSGLERHFTEWRARFIDAGYTITNETSGI